MKICSNLITRTDILTPLYCTLLYHSFQSVIVWLANAQWWLSKPALPPLYRHYTRTILTELDIVIFQLTVSGYLILLLSGEEYRTLGMWEEKMSSSEELESKVC